MYSTFVIMLLLSYFEGFYCLSFVRHGDRSSLKDSFQPATPSVCITYFNRPISAGIAVLECY